MIKPIVKTLIIQLMIFKAFVMVDDVFERRAINELTLGEGEVKAVAQESSLALPAASLPASQAKALGEFDEIIPVAAKLEAVADTDADGLSDHQERAVYQTFWYDEDTDADGFSDFVEVENNYSPKQPALRMDEADTDNDGLNDDWEIKLGTNLMLRDTDGDGHLDGSEVYAGYSPTSTESVSLDKTIIISDQDLNLQFFIAGVKLMDIPVSTGKPATPTPHGEFEILDKAPVKWYAGAGYSYPNTKWNLHFTTGRYRYYIHGAYWHDNFGLRPVSGGCVNVRYEDMEDLYNFASIGTKVVVN